MCFASFICKAVENNKIKGIDLGKDGLCVSHLLYADDCVLLGEWSGQNLKAIARVLRVFNLCSGFKIHLGKSKLFGIGVGDNEIEDMAKVVGCSACSLPFKHLGIWIGADMNRVNNWNFLIDIVESRLAKWKAASLSMAGRLVLLKSVLESLPTYSFSAFKAPIQVIDALEV
uniref:uncharacterized protein LOC122581603 n=1 Tax=Erigeron canadensis TaxID=72917 RepID=UPI001CB8BDEB|nr:uncharacterized protein LOC122581603 [Erigeron canadensis]